METDRGPFGIHSLASLGVELASIGGPPLLPRRDGLRSSVATQHSADAVMETVGVPEWRDGDSIRLGLPFLVQREKDRRLRNLLASWLAPMPLMLVSI
jgi:hypothetical protein